MKTIHLFIVCFMVCLPFRISAQEANKDALYLTNGNVVEGHIESSDSDLVKIRTFDGNLYSYKRIEVRQIKSGKAIMPTDPKLPQYKDFRSYKKGYWFAVEGSFGSTARFNKRNLQATELDYVNGYRLNEFLKVGVGIGGRCYVNNNEVRSSGIRWSMPLFADFRGNFVAQTSRTVVPYWSFDIGGTVRDRFMIRPSVGLRIGEARSCFLVGITYTGQEMKLADKTYSFENLFSLKIGYEF